MSARVRGAAAGVVAVVVIASLDRFAARNANFVLVASDRIAVLAARSAARDAGEPRGSAGTSSGGAPWLVAPAAAQTPPGNAALPRPAATPRTPDGRVDLSGVYQSSPKRGEWDPSAPGEGGGPQNDPPSLLPAARPRAQELLNRRSIDDPTAYCLPASGPRMTGVILFPIQFVQTPGQVVIIYEYMNAVRIIPTDGRPHPDDAEPTYQGDSVGRWDDDTLVVDVNNFKEGNWLAAGIVSSDKLHITERYTRIDKDQLNYEAVIEDPELLAKPWTVRRTLMLREGVRVREYVCAENNLDPARYQEYLKRPSLFMRSPDQPQPR